MSGDRDRLEAALQRWKDAAHNARVAGDWRRVLCINGEIRRRQEELSELEREQECEVRQQVEPAPTWGCIGYESRVVYGARAREVLG